MRDAKKAADLVKGAKTDPKTKTNDGKNSPGGKNPGDKRTGTGYTKGQRDSLNQKIKKVQ